MANEPIGTIPASTNPAGGDGGGGGNAGGHLPGITGGGSGPISLTDDSLISFEGAKEPVKFGEHVRGLKSNLTKATQARAAAEKERDSYRQALQDYQTRTKQSAQQAPAGGGQAAGDVFSAIAELPYLTGKDAAEVVKQIQGAISQRDQAFILIAKELQSLKGQLGGFTAKQGEADFGVKMGKFREQLGLSEDWTDWLSELYLAYEGDDLDEEFPSIAKKRIDQITQALRKGDKQKVEAAKRAPFIPGKGGQGSPSLPLQNKMKTMNARQIADSVWESMKDEDA